MKRDFSQVLIILSILILFVSLTNIPHVYATMLKDDARSYRDKGYEAQDRGDIDSAISWYQKATNLDPDYAVPHNDLGILFEAKGWLDRAESEYRKALELDFDYGKAHTNLALLYERKGELEKAAFHWMRRYRLGRSGDAWTDEARQRLEKLGLIEGLEREIQRRPRSRRQERIREMQPREPARDAEGWTRVGPEPEKEQGLVTRGLTRKYKRVKKASAWEIKRRRMERPGARARPKKVKKKKRAEKKKSEWTRLGYTPRREKTKSSRAALDKELEESLRLAEKRLRYERTKTADPTRKSVTRKSKSVGKARSYYATAHGYYKRGEYTRALDKIRAGKKIYPDDKGLSELEQRIKNTMKEERIEDHYNEGIMRYHKDDFSGARKEFEAILDILPE